MSLFSKLNGKTHAGYIVDDAEACLKNVQEIFGCALDTKSYIFAPQKAWSCGVALGKVEMRIAMCEIGDYFNMEFIQPLTPAGYHFLSGIEKGESINHVAFQTEEFDACRQELQDRGAVFVFEMEANDPVKGYRRNCYAKVPGIPGIVEILESSQPYRGE